jgi:hypothetical protein
MINQDSQHFESYLPIYDVVPEKWEDARPFLVEQFKKISDAVNIREIGWFLDEELLTGKAFVPGVNSVNGQTSQTFRQILRKVIIFPGLTIGLNTQPHGLTVDYNFTLVAMFGGASDAIALTGEPLPNGVDTISYDATNVYVTVAAAYTRASVTMEYTQEL